MSKPKELREKSSEQLTHELREAQKDLFNLRFRAETEKLDSPMKLRRLRREIARVHTVLRERELGVRGAKS